jgi:glutamate formiminotransferase
MVLTIPNWSFGRDRDLERRLSEILADAGVTVHFLAGDVDHNRTVSAFSGQEAAVFGALEAMCEEALPRIDLGRHSGVHPRIGALDVCPFVPLDGTPVQALAPEVDAFAAWLADAFDLPVFLYEKSERGRHEADLPALRRGGFGGLFTRELNPDFGPRAGHPRLGATVVGVRDFLIAMNANLRTGELSVAKRLARTMRELREEGDLRFLGVRALGLPLASRCLTQVSMNLTLPGVAPPDPVLEWVEREALALGAAPAGNELIGVIRPCDLPGATRLPVRPEQVVPGAA